MTRADAIPAGRLARFARGVALPLRGLAAIASQPSTWPFALAPVLLTALGLTLGIFFGWGVAARLLGLVWTEPEGFMSAFWELARTALFGVLLLSASLLPPMVLAAPFLDRLSARIEAKVLGTSTDGGLGRAAREALTSVGNALARLVRFGLVQALIFVIALIPVIHAAYPFLAFAWSAIWLAEAALDQTSSRHLHGWREVRAAMRAVRPMGFGMGVVLAAMFLIPLANLFLVPIATASGALFYCDLRAGGVLTEPPTQ